MLGQAVGMECVETEGAGMGVCWGQYAGIECFGTVCFLGVCVICCFNPVAQEQAK